MKRISDGNQKEGFFLPSINTIDKTMTKIKISNGNRKIGNNTLIINMQSATDCSSKKLGLCKHCGICYAMKAERQYPQVLPYRRSQAKIWNSLSAQEIASQILNISGVKNNRIKYLRFSESGDFTNQSDVTKINTIAGLLEGKLLVYGYTARKDLNYSGLSRNLIINGSGFMATNEFKAVKQYSGQALKCKGNCRDCNLCKTNSHKKIEVLFH